MKQSDRECFSLLDCHIGSVEIYILILLYVVVLGDAFTVQFWCDAGSLLEQTAEIIDVRDAALLCDRFGWELGHDEELLCLVDALAVDVVSQWDADFLLEQRGQVAGIDIQPFGHCL